MSEVQPALNNTIPYVHETSQITGCPSQILFVSEMKVSRDNSGRLTIAFPYNSLLVTKVKTIEGYRWHPDKKHWSFPNVDGTLDRILKVFESERIHLDPTLQVNLPFLFDQVHKAVQTHHYSHRTEETYVQWIKRFVHFNGNRHPSEMSEKEINAFLSHLAVNEHVSASTQNQALCAIVFLYRHVLNREIGLLDGLIRAKRPKRLPVVLTKQEVKNVLKFLDRDKWLMISLLYGAGLRLMECLRLRVKDVDFIANQVLVREGKGNKDRLTMLPETVKESLAEQPEKSKTIASTGHTRRLRACLYALCLRT